MYNTIAHAGLLLLLVTCQITAAASAEEKAPGPQYVFEKISIPAATADEPMRAQFSMPHANGYLEGGAIAWSKQRKCVSCHTNGIYMTVRPSLSEYVGRPSEKLHEFFVGQYQKMKETDLEKLRKGIGPTQAAYIAWGLAEWDAQVSGSLSRETDMALKLMFELQEVDGAFGNTRCWPPYESSNYHGATVAAMAAATAPGWSDAQENGDLNDRISKLKDYLRNSTPPHDYGRLLLLWASTRVRDLLDAERIKELTEVVWKHQRHDGGWSIRSFSAPENWGGGNRAEKLRAEPQFKDPPSDGHLTGLAVIVLRDVGVSADDPRIKNAVDWLLSNQRQSGRWWTRSLNTDKYHFITYSGTAFPLLALAKCGVLPVLE